MAQTLCCIKETRDKNIVNEKVGLTINKYTKDSFLRGIKEWNITPPAGHGWYWQLEQIKKLNFGHEERNSPHLANAYL